MVSTRNRKSASKTVRRGNALKRKAKVISPKVKKEVIKNMKIMEEENAPAVTSPELKKNMKINCGKKAAEQKSTLQKWNLSQKHKAESNSEIGEQISFDDKDSMPKKLKKSLEADSVTDSKVSKKAKRMKDKASVSSSTKERKEECGKNAIGDAPTSQFKEKDMHKSAKEHPTTKEKQQLKEKKKKAIEVLPEFQYTENKLMTKSGDYWVRRKSVPKLKAMAVEKKRMIRHARETGKEKLSLTKEERSELSNFMARKRRTEAKKLRLVLIRIAKKQLKSKDGTGKEEPVVRQRKSKKNRNVNDRERRRRQERNRVQRRKKHLDPIITRHCCDNLKIMGYLVNVRGKLMNSGLQVSEQKRRLKMAAKRAERIFKEKGRDFKPSDLQ